MSFNRVAALKAGLVYLNANHAAQRGKAMRLYTEVEG